MQRLRYFLLGVIVILVVQLISIAVIISRAHGWSALEKPTGIEEWIAQRAREAAVPVAARQRQNPIDNSGLVIGEAAEHWADHCALCHGDDGRGDTVIGTHLYPPAPDMRARAVQSLTDGELFFAIQNGIRLSGMPAWGGAHEEDDSWKLVRFIRHIPDLTTDETEELKKLNPNSRDEEKHH